ncbi:hypothetical protein LSTR_LSTR001861 [Laodelphax striatellus]|uniref:Uncharacterized protein n=1 Tax=Laodelphax striatellus TaxID=195883 RepID=A0A482WFY4_LAOST|nr:hypothetical protein LSTR_LSTR001861 [Laodelphax striatellus]
MNTTSSTCHTTCTPFTTTTRAMFQSTSTSTIMMSITTMTITIIATGPGKLSSTLANSVSMTDHGKINHPKHQTGEENSIIILFRNQNKNYSDWKWKYSQTVPILC